MKIKLKKLLKWFFLSVSFSVVLVSSCSLLRNNEPNHLVFKYLKQKYWNRDVIDIDEQWIKGEKRFINFYNTDNYYLNYHPKDEYEFMESYRFNSRNFWDGWNVSKSSGRLPFGLDEPLTIYSTYEGIENIRGYDLLYVKKNSFLFETIKKFFKDNDNFIVVRRYEYLNYFDDPPKKMIGINLNFLEKNKINMTINHKKDFLWYDDKFRRQNENINLMLIIHNLPKEINDSDTLNRAFSWRKSEQYFVIPTKKSYNDFQKIDKLEVLL
ncbi:hypothetical protein RRG40_04425 [Mycoplasmopsis felis]|uniref:hypothetical protein n=1 Tax=Mycoplasmopsis felis TaxID=33923 RepID=UPI002B002225|nr:hypothetical protein [Mycoplasmopsis felis]WQQ05367.1 hypothetical protein RRG59_03385 [Mycoplasmopsis felis]